MDNIAICEGVRRDIDREYYDCFMQIACFIDNADLDVAYATPEIHSLTHSICQDNCGASEHVLFIADQDAAPTNIPQSHSEFVGLWFFEI